MDDEKDAVSKSILEKIQDDLKAEVEEEEANGLVMMRGRKRRRRRWSQ